MGSGSTYLSLEQRDLIKTVYPSDGLFDHMTVIAGVGDKLVSHPIKKCSSYRRVKGIPLTDLISDIKLSALISHPKLTFSELYQQCHTVLRYVRADQD